MTRDHIVLLDGGMGQELIHRGYTSDSPIWSAYALVEHPDAVRQVHADYGDAGADVFVANSYPVSRHRLALGGIEHRFAELNRLAGRLAREQADRYPGVRVAGSLPPQHGSYRPDIAVPEHELTELYAEQAALVAPYCDLLLCETMASAAEARAAATGAARSGLPVWVAWTLCGGGQARLRSGETVAQAVAALEQLSVAALLFNCCEPESITLALAELRDLTDLPIGAHANGFADIPDDWEISDDTSLPAARVDLTPERYRDFVLEWIDLGATVVGGCCEIGPEHIRLLRTTIDG